MRGKELTMMKGVGCIINFLGEESKKGLSGMVRAGAVNSERRAIDCY